MGEDIRARIANALATAGIEGFKDTTTRIRPQWRASFSFRGELHGETSYVHLHVPADADQLQVNSTASSPALDLVPTDRLQEMLAEVNGALVPGSVGLERIVEELGAAPADVAGWEVLIMPYQGFEHRMMLAKVTMPLACLSGESVDLAIRLGLSLARIARELVAAACDSPGEASDSSAL